jgi:hypothetical protein
MTCIKLLFAIAAIAAAPVFYSLLGQRRQWAYVIYGLGEIVAGFGIIIFTLFPPASGILASSNLILGVLFKVAGVSAGVYMMVRGLKDLREGLPASCREWWDARFRLPPQS